MNPIYLPPLKEVAPPEGKELALDDFLIGDIDDSDFYFERLLWPYITQQFSIMWNTALFRAGENIKQMIASVPVQIYWNGARTQRLAGVKLVPDFEKLIIQTVNEKISWIRSLVFLEETAGVSNLSYVPYKEAPPEGFKRQ